MSDFRVVSIASSSKGNCILVIAGSEIFLIDCGISASELLRKIKLLRIPELPHKILISHEHYDHTSGIASISKKYRIKIFANSSTLNGMNDSIKKSNFEKEVFISGNTFAIGKVKIKPFRIFHDTKEPVGFSIIYRDSKVVYLVDAGRITDENLKEMADAELVILDSNYDNLSLLQGRYPPSVKKRIMEFGHLSNEIVANIILNHSNPETEFWLAHLSKENNTPALAATTVNYILKNGNGRKTNFQILPRNRIGPIWEKKKAVHTEVPIHVVTISGGINSKKFLSYNVEQFVFDFDTAQ